MALTSYDNKKAQERYDARKQAGYLDKDAPTLSDTTDVKDTLLAGGKGAAKGAAQGFQMTKGTGFGAVGAFVGGAIGLVGGMLGQSRKDVGEFKQLQSTFQIGKDKEKLAKQAQKEALAAAKRAKEGGKRGPDLRPVVEADRDIVSMMGGSGTSHYDLMMNKTYGYGVA